MEWTQYLAGFFAGAFLANTVPHFVYGVCGDKFPTPFAKPPGKGLSSPTVNVVWALVNLMVGCILFHKAAISWDDIPSLLIFFAGIALMSIMLSINFQKKHKE